MNSHGLQGSVVCIGLCCLDFVAKSDQFPIEDTDERVSSIDCCLGGNAAHNSVVLAALESTSIFFAGSLPCLSSLNGRLISQEFSKHSIDICLSESSNNFQCPVSMVIVNNSNGSRTILHCRRNFPEYSFSTFSLSKIIALNVNWIHFEGRYNVPEIVSVLAQIKSLSRDSSRQSIYTSIELEKCLPEFSSLLTNVDVVFLSKEFAQFHGAASKTAAVELFRCKVDMGATVICAWGSLGCAGAVNAAPGTVVSVDAVAPATVVDTLGAGDTFIAGCVHGFRRGWPLDATLRFASALAGEKCTRTDGFDRVAEWAPVVAGRQWQGSQS